MKWQKPPSPEILQAEGNGYSLSAQIVRGLGTLATFTRDRGRIGSRAARWAPTKGADSLAFGIVPVHSKLHVPELEERHLVDRFREWDKSKDREHFNAFKQDEKDGRVRSGLPDFVALVAPLCTDIHYPIFRVPRRAMWGGGIDHLEEWDAFRHELGLFLQKEGGGSDLEKTANGGGDVQTPRRPLPHLRWMQEEMDRLGKWGSFIVAGRGCNSTAEIGARFQLERVHELCCAFLLQFNEMTFRRRGRQGQPPATSNYYELVSRSFACVFEKLPQLAF